MDTPWGPILSEGRCEIYKIVSLAGIILAHIHNLPFWGNFVEKYSNSSTSLHTCLIKIPILSRRRSLSKNLGAFKHMGPSRIILVWGHLSHCHMTHFLLNVQLIFIHFGSFPLLKGSMILSNKLVKYRERTSGVGHP